MCWGQGALSLVARTQSQLVDWGDLGRWPLRRQTAQKLPCSCWRSQGLSGGVRGSLRVSELLWLWRETGRVCPGAPSLKDLANSSKEWEVPPPAGSWGGGPILCLLYGGVTASGTHDFLTPFWGRSQWGEWAQCFSMVPSHSLTVPPQGEVGPPGLPGAPVSIWALWEGLGSLGAALQPDDREWGWGSPRTPLP